MRHLCLALCVLAPVALATAGAAEAPTPPPPDTPATDGCRAAPAGAPTGKSDQEPGAAAQAPNGGLSDKLADCNGVLTPPATGDGEIVAPPPETGKTPVIPPGTLPPQPTPK